MFPSMHGVYDRAGPEHIIAMSMCPILSSPSGNKVDAPELS